MSVDFGPEFGVDGCMCIYDDAALYIASLSAAEAEACITLLSQVALEIAGNGWLCMDVHLSRIYIQTGLHLLQEKEESQVLPHLQGRAARAVVSRSLSFHLF